MTNLIMPVVFSALAFMNAGPDSISWAPLSSANHDCDTVADAAICRVKRPYTAAELSEKIDAGQEVWREGHQLTFATRGNAEAMLLSGGVQLPMSRLVGTDMWVITVRIPRIEEAFVTWFFVPVARNQDRTLAFKPKVWRGPRAFETPTRYEHLEGHVYGESLYSTNLKASRDVHIYVPPAFGSDGISGVLYMGDGGSVLSLAKVVEPAILTGKLPRIVIVGIHADSAVSPIDGRAAEYIAGFEESNARFHAHEQFVLTEVIPLVRRKFQVPADPKHVGIGGYSNSAGWAITMGLRHPDVFGKVIAFSPGGRKAAVPETLDVARLPASYFLGGILEPGFHQRAVEWADLFKKHGARHILREPVAGHDTAMWEAYIVDALDWTFNAK